MNSSANDGTTSAKRNLFMQLMPRRIQKIVGLIAPQRWIGRQEVLVSGGPIAAEYLSLAQAKKLPMKKVRPGEYFFGKDQADKNQWRQKWFRVEVPAPKIGDTGRRVFQWDCRGETTVYVDGQVWAGLDVAHPFCFIPDKKCTLWLDCGTYHTGIWYPGKQPDEYGLRFDNAWVTRVNETAWEVYWDFEALLLLMTRLLEQHNLRVSYGWGYHQRLESSAPLMRKLIRRLHDACDTYETKGMDALKTELRKIYTEFPAEYWQLDATLAGHAHIDYVWLWPERVTRRKTVHTFANMTHLMDYYPEFRFTSSSPALYEAVRQAEPDLFRRIKGLIRNKKWEATGGAWVEPDTHMPCGEALARSVVYGQRYFTELRGSMSKLLWLPDVFGYSASLPQIMQLGGIDYFSTTKLNWSHVNRFPFTSFVWRGNDGSEVLSHLIPGAYNGENPFTDLPQMERTHIQSCIHPEIMSPVGIGDGGGGATIKALELSRRVQNLAQIPRAKWGFMEGFCERMEPSRDKLPVYAGELYLEIHRGTYTTQSQYKLAYRKTETALQAYEAARVVTGKGPIDRAPWDRLVCAQFHDAIPGSSIGLVYKELGGELQRLHPDLLSKAKTEIEEANAKQSVAFNPLLLPRNAVFSVRDSDLFGEKPVFSQKTGRDNRLVWAKLKGLEGAPLGTIANQPKPEWTVSTKVLSNGIVKADFDGYGRLAKIAVDGKPIRLANPCGFMMYQDRPADFDAWDIDQYSTYLGAPAAQRMALRVVEKGPLRAIVRGEAKLSNKSSVILDYVLEYGSPWLKIEMQIDWHDDFVLLKYHLPTDYMGKQARYGCPFGSVLRPQLPGSSETEAMWEVPASRWAALGDDDGTPGLAVVTEAKYGFSCREGNLGLSLLKAAKEPDPNADRGEHSIRFAIGRHSATSQGSRLNTAAAAEALFAPIIVAKRKRAIEPMVEFDKLGTLVPSWILPSETGRGYIVRMHETMGGHGNATISTTKAFRSAGFVDLLERPIAKAQTKGANRVEIKYTPHKVISLAIR